MAGDGMFDDLFPMLSVQDLSRSLAFYEGLLGGRVTYRFPPDDPQFVTVRVGGGTVGIGVDPEAHLEERSPDLPFSLCVYAENCDAAIAHLRGLGVRVLSEPEDQAWGERMALVTDPDGNRVVIMERT